MKNNIIRALEEMEKEDIYSLMLFVLYKMKDDPKYSTLSELVYLVDNDSFVRLLKHFEGQTITIPKLEDFKDVLSALCFYERTANTNMSEDEIFKELDIPQSKRESIKEIMEVILKYVGEYDFVKSKETEE